MNYYCKHSQVYQETGVRGWKAAEGKSRVKVRGEIQDTIVSKIPAEHLPEARVTLNRKPELLPLT